MGAWFGAASVGAGAAGSRCDSCARDSSTTRSVVALSLRSTTGSGAAPTIGILRVTSLAPGVSALAPGVSDGRFDGSSAGARLVPRRARRRPQRPPPRGMASVGDESPRGCLLEVDGWSARGELSEGEPERAPGSAFICSINSRTVIRLRPRTYRSAARGSRSLPSLGFDERDVRGVDGADESSRSPGSSPCGLGVQRLTSQILVPRGEAAARRG